MRRFKAGDRVVVVRPCCDLCGVIVGLHATVTAGSTDPYTQIRLAGEYDLVRPFLIMTSLIAIAAPPIIVRRMPRMGLTWRSTR